MSDYDESRIRSFIERYVIERASLLPKGEELDAAWQVMLDGRTIYLKIEQLAKSMKIDTTSLLP